jgi:hypothetical protein
VVETAAVRLSTRFAARVDAVIAPSVVVRDELVRRLADRLEVPPSYLTPEGPALRGGARGSPTAASPGAPPAHPGSPNGAGAAAPGRGGNGPSGPPGRPHGAVATLAERTEQAFLAMCIGQPRVGRELLERAGKGYLSRRMEVVRRHLLGHLDDPLAELPEDEELAALVTETAMLAEAEPSSEPVLRLTFLQLDLRRVERELRRAAEERDFERHGRLVREREEVRDRIDALMGEAD